MTPVVDVEPADFAEHDDPYPLFSRIRETAPLARTPSGFWLATGHATVLEVLRHPAATSGPIALRYLDALPPGAARDEMTHRINFLDPPDHPRVRGLVSKAFTPRRIGDLRAFTVTTAETLLGDLDRSHSGGDELDLLGRFAHQLPSLVISELLGVPPADRDQLTAWSDAVTPLLGVQLDPGERDRALAAAEEFHSYLSALLEERRRAPGNDLLSALLEAEDAGERLSRVELLSLAATLYSAGHRTTRDLVSNGLSVLLADEVLRGQAIADPASVPSVVQEFLRFETPTLFVARVPAEPMVVGGVDIGPLEPILVVLAAANRDPDAYSDPDRFDPGRWDTDGDGSSSPAPSPGPPPAPVSFAFGAHYCLGASLARMEAEVMVGAVLARWPHIELAPRPLQWRHRGPFRSLDALWVRPWGSRPGAVGNPT